MAAKNVKIWYDAEGDYLEVIFEQNEGYFRETSSDQVMEKVDADGNVLGSARVRIPSNSTVRRPPSARTIRSSNSSEAVNTLPPI